MAKDLEELVLSISADNRQMLRVLKKMESDTTKTTRDVERRFDAMAKNIDGRLAGIGRNAFRGLLGGAAAALGTRELVRLADTWTDLTSRVNIAAGSMEAGTAVMGRLGEMARRTYSSLEQTVESYVANSTALKELGYSTTQQLDFTESLNNALVVSGARGQRAATVQDALSRAMAGGKLSGRELNTVITQGGRVAEALAEGLGVGVNQLRALGQQGKITGRDIVSALGSQMEKLRKEAESMPATISDGIQLLNNALLQYVGNADTATGISAKISEALQVMADNFDTAADTGLRLASILAAGLLGRSIAGMVRTLGLGSTALIQFTRAMTAARTMASLQTAFVGLGAAAGPAGVVIGAGLATALVVAQANAQDAEERTARLNVEFERLGLRGKQAAKGVEETAEALHSVADKAHIQTLKDINAELDRMRGSGSWNPFAQWFSGAEDQAKELGAIIRQAGNSLVGGTGTDIDRGAYGQILKIAAAVRDSEMSINDAFAAAEKLGRLDISDPVRELNEELKQSIAHFGNLRVAEFARGQTAELDEITASVIRLTDQYDLLHIRQRVPPEHLRQLDELRDRLKKGGDAAEKAMHELLAFANSDPDFEGLAQTLDPIIARLNLVIQRTAEAAAAVSRVSGLSPQSIEAYTQYGASRVAGRGADESSAAYEAEARRRAALGREELALETEIARVREQSLRDGEDLTEDRIRRIAEINLSGNASRTTEGKKPTKERADEYQRLAERIRESTAAMVAETEVQRGLNPLIDDYGYAVERARAEHELLTAAQKAGLEITPQLRNEIENLADTYATATVEAAKLGETQDEIRRKAEEMRDFQKDLTRGLIDGFIQGKKAADIFADALSKIGNKLLDMALNSAFDSKGGGGGGWLQSLISSIFKREHGGPVRKGVPYVVGEKRPELFVPDSNGTIVPRVPTMPDVVKPNTGGIHVSITMAPQIDNRGASSEAVAKTAAELAKLKAELPARVTAAVRQAQTGRML